METRIKLKKGWKILQDVHDTGEKIGLYAACLLYTSPSPRD